jgi:hypothetical protein
VAHAFGGELRKNAENSSSRGGPAESHFGADGSILLVVKLGRLPASGMDDPVGSEFRGTRAGLCDEQGHLRDEAAFRAM